MKAKQYKTSRKTGGYVCQVVGHNGLLTGFKLLVPYSVNKQFTLGDVVFNIKNSKFAECVGEFPASWLIDLNEEIY